MKIVLILVFETQIKKNRVFTSTTPSHMVEDDLARCQEDIKARQLGEFPLKENIGSHSPVHFVSMEANVPIPSNNN